MKHRLAERSSAVLAALIVLLIGTDATAQFEIGGSAGLLRANLWGDKPSNSRYQPFLTISGSAVLDYRLSSEISLSIQPGYVRGGSDIGYKPPLGGEVSDSASVRLEYLSVPVLARIVTKGAFYVSTGPVFGRLLDASGWLDGSDDRTDLSDQFESTDLGFVFGVGKLIPRGKLTTFIELRMVWGFANIGVTSLEESRVRNTGQHLIVGALYNLGG